MSANPPRNVLNNFIRIANQMAVNLSGRSTLAGLLTGGRTNDNLDQGNRNLDKECGYIEGDPTMSDYRMMVEQEGLANRCVWVYPDECFAVYPDLYETEDDKATPFEEAWDEFEYHQDPWYYLRQLYGDTRLGQCGILLYGFNDLNNRKGWERIVPNLNEKDESLTKGAVDKSLKVLYTQSYAQDSFRIDEYEKDKFSPRFGMPKYYSIKILNPNNNNLSAMSADASDEPLTEIKVHWSRVLHLAEGTKFLGKPILKDIHRRIYDVRKILGGSGEMFYRGGFPGISFETLPELTDESDIDMESMKKEIEEYSEGLKRYMRLIGMTAKSLAPQVASPTDHLEEQYRYISAATSVPIPILVGETAGQLASDQVSVRWNRKIGAIQTQFLNPRAVRPYVERLFNVGILPKPKGGRFTNEWRDLNALSDKDKADIALKKAQAILQYVTSGSVHLLKPRKFMTLVLKFTDDEAQSIIKDFGGEEKMIKALEAQSDPMAGNTPNTTGTNPSAKTGASGNTNAQGKTAKKQTSSRNGGRGKKVSK